MNALDRLSIPPKYRPAAIGVAAFVGVFGLLSCCCGGFLLPSGASPKRVADGGQREWLAAPYADQMAAAELLVRENHPDASANDLKIRAHVFWADAQAIFTAEDGAGLDELSLRELCKMVVLDHSDREPATAATAPPAPPREWKECFRFSGRGIKASAPFTTTGNSVRLKWTMRLGREAVHFTAVTFMDRDGRSQGVVTCEDSEGESMVYLPAGEYHMNVNSFGSSYDLVVECQQ